MSDTGPDMTNGAIADRLEEVAAILEGQDADRFRVAAYRKGAATVRHHPRSMSEILDAEGVEGLLRLPSIGETLADGIRTMVRTGRLPQLERLRGDSDPESLFRTLPGVGPEFAERLHRELGVDTLEGLEAAAYDGRLEQLEGFGPRRAEALRATLGSRLRRVRGGRAATPAPPPTVAELLDVDAEYRRRAEADELPRIAPRRFNPEGEAWLPVLHTRRGGRDYTALFSNTPQAHRLGRVRDWVVLYPENGAAERPFTVVTERRGPLAGRRVVRGRELECRRHYGVDAA